jgi:two-component sensor histidine kinase/PAS domain-containing protein
MASICFTIALYDFLAWSRRGAKAQDIAFALTCLGGTFYNLACAGEYNVDLPVQSVIWLKAQAISLNLTGLAFLWFIAEETKLVKRRYVVGFVIWNILAVLSQILDLGDLAWIASRPFVNRVPLPFGLDFTYMEVEEGPVIDALQIAGVALIAYLIRIVVEYRRLGNRREARVLLWVLAVVSVAYLNDFAVGGGLYSFVFLVEYAWLAVILIVGLRRSNEIMEAAFTKQALRQSEKELRESQATLTAIVDSTLDMIWSVDPDSFGLLTFNESMRDYFQKKRGFQIERGMRPEELFPTEDFVRRWRDFYRRALAEGAYSTEYNVYASPSVLQLSFNVLKRDGKLFGLSVFGKDITERKLAEEQINKSLIEKETLLRELYHRTKNNMNVIISMLKLQSNQTGDERLKEAFSETEDRIISMSMVHEKLYEAQDLSHINLKEYIEDLARHLLANYSVSNDHLSLALRMDDVRVLIDTAISCGLIINELISNALKYAFPDGRAGRLEIRLSQDEDREITLVVSDDGVGLPPGFDVKHDGHLGFRLINSLAQSKLRARLGFEANHGLSCSLSFREGSTYAKE